MFKFLRDHAEPNNDMKQRCILQNLPFGNVKKDMVFLCVNAICGTFFGKPGIFIEKTTDKTKFLKDIENTRKGFTCMYQVQNLLLDCNKDALLRNVTITNQRQINSIYKKSSLKSVLKYIF